MVFSCEFGKIFTNTFFCKTPPVAASVFLDTYAKSFLKQINFKFYF